MDVISIVKLDQSGSAEKLELTLAAPKGSTSETMTRRRPFVDGGTTLRTIRKCSRRHCYSGIVLIQSEAFWRNQGKGYE